MYHDFIFSILALSGITLAWRQVLLDNSRLLQAVQRHTGMLAKPLTCGFCFPFWLSLVFVIFFNPIPEWEPIMRFALPHQIYTTILFLLNWMLVGTCVLAVRFTITLIIETSYHVIFNLLKNVKK